MQTNIFLIFNFYIASVCTQSKHQVFNFHFTFKTIAKCSLERIRAKARAANLKVEGPHCILILQILSQPEAEGPEIFGILTLDWLKAHCYFFNF